MRINERETSSKARWSVRLSLFMAQLAIVTILLHRFAALGTPATTNLLVITLLGAATSILLSVLAFVTIWNKGIKGTGFAVSGFLVSLLIFALPLYHLPALAGLPAINDVTTDLLSPPQFHKIASLREPGANGTNYQGALFIEKQAKAYPDIGTLTLERPTSDSYDLIRGVVDDLGWQVVSEKQPGKGNGTGVIEAIDRSLLLGFKDDVVIRITGNQSLSRIDMRSASRFGRHDLGSNANRIREVFGIVKTRIARAEAKKLDAIERARIAQQQLEEKKKRELARKRREQQPIDPDSVMLPKAQFDQVGIVAAPGQGNLDAYSVGGETTSSSRRTPTSGFGIAGEIARSQQIPTSRTQKIQRSKRDRGQKSWVPFKFDVP